MMSRIRWWLWDWSPLYYENGYSGPIRCLTPLQYARLIWQRFTWPRAMQPVKGERRFLIVSFEEKTNG